MGKVPNILYLERQLGSVVRDKLEYKVHHGCRVPCLLFAIGFYLILTRNLEGPARLWIHKYAYTQNSFFHSSTYIATFCLIIKSLASNKDYIYQIPIMFKTIIPHCSVRFLGIRFLSVSMRFLGVRFLSVRFLSVRFLSLRFQIVRYQI